MKNWAELQITLHVSWKRPTYSDDIKQTHACIYNAEQAPALLEGIHWAEGEKQLKMTCVRIYPVKSSTLDLTPAL